MKKHFKRGIALLFAVIIAISFCGCGEGDDFIKPTEAFFVNDFADVINADDEQKILSQGATLQENTKAQAVVATIETLDGKPIEEYEKGKRPHFRGAISICLVTRKSR